MKCSACGEAAVWLGADPCFPCVKARAKTVANHGRCTCPKKLKRPRPVSTGIRSWIACDRCLGAIAQKNPALRHFNNRHED